MFTHSYLVVYINSNKELFTQLGKMCNCVVKQREKMHTCALDASDRVARPDGDYDGDYYDEYGNLYGCFWR